MNRKISVACVIVLVLVLKNSYMNALQAPSGSVCWPLHFAGITLGETNDSEVRRLLGQGAFRKDQSDTGGRYFTDLNGTATLHVVSCTDEVVCELTVRAGIDPAINSIERKASASRWFRPEEGFGNWHALHLGSPREDVLKNLGRPKNKVLSNEWTYETTCACEIPEYFTVFFAHGHVVKVVFSAPAG